MRWNFAWNGTLQEYTAGVGRSSPCRSWEAKAPVRHRFGARGRRELLTSKAHAVKTVVCKVACTLDIVFPLSYLFIRDDVNFSVTEGHDEV